MKSQCYSAPRFYNRWLPASLGLLAALIGGFFLLNTVLAMMTDTSAVLIAASAVMALMCAAGLLFGILAVCAAFEKVDISESGIRVRLGALTLLRVPKENIRSIIPITKEYRRGWGERRIYLLRVYAFGGIFRNTALWIQWSDKTEEALRGCFPDVNYLL